jgi:hypothetical protein
MPVKPQDDQNDEPANRIIASMFATIRTPRSRPVIAAVRMRRGKAADSRGAPKFAADPGHRGRSQVSRVKVAGSSGLDGFEADGIRAATAIRRRRRSAIRPPTSICCWQR